MIIADYLSKAVKNMPKEGPGIRGEQYISSGLATWRTFEPEIKLSEVGSVLDIGCGHGRMAIPFLGTETNYVGLDILPGMIEWADKTFAPWASLRFYEIPVSNAFYRPKGTAPENFKVVDYTQDRFDVVLLLSVFTHIQKLDIAVKYLKQAMGCLKPKGKIVASWFCSPPNQINVNADRTVFSKDALLDIFKDFNLKIVKSWGGNSTDWHDQFVTILEYDPPA